MGAEGHEVNGFNNVKSKPVDMLPDTLHMFDKEDRKAYCRVLAAVALSDGRVSMEEFANYESRMGMALTPKTVQCFDKNSSVVGVSPMLLTGCTLHTCELHSAMPYSWLLQMGIMIREMDVVKQLAERMHSHPKTLKNCTIGSMKGGIG